MPFAIQVELFAPLTRFDDVWLHINLNVSHVKKVIQKIVQKITRKVKTVFVP